MGKTLSRSPRSPPVNKRVLGTRENLRRESTFIMPRGGGMKMLRGGTEIFSGLKGGALKVLDILKGGSKLFKVLAPANSS
jgi:hypothetical protein